MNIWKHTLILLISLILAVLMVYSSIIWGSERPILSTNPSDAIERSHVAITRNDANQDSLAYTPMTTPGVSVGTGIVSVEFGRLATAFVIQQDATIFTRSGAHDIIFAPMQGIISLYDPFSNYVFSSQDQSYTVRQVTSGSYYLGYRDNGIISIYSIDAVIDLDLYADGVKMTSITLFPGMYIGFDPKSNRELRDADLFRMMVYFDSDQAPRYSGIEFVNPRVSIAGSEGDEVFRIFRLPLESKTLFQMLHIMFRDRIKQVDLIKQYSASSVATLQDIDPMIYNPTKQNYYLLDGLKSTLSKAVQSQMDPQIFRRDIESIHTASSRLVSGNSVDLMLEGFLTDARFAIFGNAQNTKFTGIYNETANILGITPDPGKGKLLQYLSDIYSRNMISKKGDTSYIGIDTYTPTANGLQKTLESTDISTKDYFDIALYAYYILQKTQTQEKNLISDDRLSLQATYALIDTILGATQRYADGLNEIDAQRSAYHALVIQFYEPIAQVLTRSLYNRYLTQSEKGLIIVPAYLDGDRVVLDHPELIGYLDHLYGSLQQVYEKVSPLYTPNDPQSGLLSLRDSILRIGVLLEITRDGAYKKYQQTPYSVSSLNGVSLPTISPDGVLQKYTQPLVVDIPSSITTTLTGSSDPVAPLLDIDTIQGYRINSSDI